MKSFYKFILLFSLSIFLINCNHKEKDSSKNANIDKQGQDEGKDTEDPELTLGEMYVYYQKVENGKVSITLPEINDFDIIAKFNYKDVKLEEIPVKLQSSPFILTKNETLNLSVPAVVGKYKEWKGSISIEKLSPVPQDLKVIDSVVFAGGRDGGKILNANLKEYTEIKQGGYPTIEMKGNIFQFLVGSKKEVWTSCRFNGKDVPVNKKLFLWKSGFTEVLNLLEIKGIMPVHLEANINDKKTAIHFKIKRIGGTIDIPDIQVFVNKKKVSIMEELEKIQNSSWPIFDGIETTPCTIVWSDNVVEECKINNQIQTIKNGEDEDGKFCYVEYLAKDCTSEGKEITVELKSNKKEIFHDVKLEFKVRKQ